MKSPHNQFGTRSYDRLSGVYQLLETIVFGPWLQKTRLAHIDRLQDAKTVLILGEGDGRFLKEFLKLNPDCQVDCLDKSSAMLATTQERLKKKNIVTTNINFIHADALSYDYPVKSYDAIVTLFFLDNFKSSQLEELIPKLLHSLKHEGKWLVADFQQPQKGIMKYIGSSLLWVMYRFFRWQTDISAESLVNPQPFLAKQLTVVVSKHYFASLLYSELWSRDDSAKYASTQARVSG